MFRTVLVLPAGTDAQQPALRRARSCVAEGGEIIVFEAVYEPMLEGYLGNKAIYEPLRQRVVKERQTAMDELARSVAGPGVKAAGRAVWGHPLQTAVADEVRARAVDLVVATPTEIHAGRRGVRKHAALSHSDWQVVMGCPAPLLVVRGEGQPKYRDIVAAVDPFHTRSKTAALDLEILRCAEVVQSRTSATLTALHCYAPLGYFGADLNDLAGRGSQVVDDRRLALEKLCVEAGVGADAPRIEAGTPHVVLSGLQDKGEADLIVMGALARGGLAQFLLGSTTERVLHEGRVDVLVVKEPGAAAP
jgi:universal stress protein E